MEHSIEATIEELCQESETAAAHPSAASCGVLRFKIKIFI